MVLTAVFEALFTKQNKQILVWVMAIAVVLWAVDYRFVSRCGNIKTDYKIALPPLEQELLEGEVTRYLIKRATSENIVKFKLEPGNSEKIKCTLYFQ